MKKKKSYLRFVSLTAGVLTMLGALVHATINPMRTGALRNCEEGIHISQIEGWTSGNRHSGINFTLDAGSKVTPTANTAIVIDYENLAVTDTYVSFYLNNLATTHRLNSTNAEPQGELYLFNDQTHVKTYQVSTGTADIFVKNTEIGTYNKMVIKISHFNGVYAEGVETDLTSLFYATRLNLSKTDRTKSDIKGLVKGIYTCEFAGVGAPLDLTGATKIYTPAANNFTSLSGNYDASAKYLALEGKYAVPTDYELSDDGNGTLSLTDKVFVGAKVTLTITPKSIYYVLEKLTVNISDVTTEVVGNKYVIESVPEGGFMAHAKFKEAEPVNCTLIDDGNGTLSLDKETIYAGDSVVITIKPNHHYELGSLKVDGADVTNEVVDGKYTVASVPSGGFTANVTFDKVINFTGENGWVKFLPFAAGEDTVITIVPDAGYEVEAAKIGGTPVVLNKFNKYLVTAAAKPLEVMATFKKATIYQMDEASLFSINNRKLCNTFALWDCVNVKTAVTLENTTEQFVGLTLNDLNKAVEGTENLVLQVQNTDSYARTFFVEVNGTAADGSKYFLLDRLGNVIPKTGEGIEVGTYARFVNATFDSQADMEGFAGHIILPLARYGALTKIDTITVRTAVTKTSRARFNLGSIYLDTTLNKEVGWIDEISETNLVWRPGETNWSTYVTPAAGEGENPINYTEQYTRTKFLEAGTMVYGLKDEVVPESPNYDTFHGTFPQNMIGEDGYVDLKSLGIKGIIFDVVNANVEQVQFAIRIAGAENISLTNTSLPLWQTSTSGNGRFAKVIYDCGVVQNRGSRYLPFSPSLDTVFNGSMYVPLSTEGFTKISSDAGDFPEKIQPVFRILFADPKDYYIDYAAKITNYRFVTDDTPYQTNTVTLIGPDCTINANVGSMSVQNDANNHLLDGTTLTFDIEPETGYHVESVTAAADGVETILLPDNNGKYTIVVTSDTVISVVCAPNVYNINYHLDGGTNSENNPDSYEYGGLAIELEDPTKEGYRFLGWIDEEGEEITEIDTFAAKDYNLTARWEKIAVADAGPSNKTTLIIVGASVGTALVAGGIVTFFVVKRKKG
ncbi:MAG: InlB B-repeat-containing protein [Bacilli bacterium]